MALKIFHCTKCEEDFKYGEWDCKGGGRHQVAPKSYYSAAASWRTYTAEEKLIHVGESGLSRVVPARPVQFNKGVFTTSDPEDQFTLDSHKGLISAEQWREKFIPKEEQFAMRDRELAAREERLVKHEQSLLEQAKAQTQAKPEPEPEAVGGEKRGKK